MGSKHDILSQEEVTNHNLSWPIEQLIEAYRLRYSKKVSEMNILDWGCGRGKSVIKLLEKGYIVKGFDPDEKVLKKGYPVLESMGYDPSEILISPAALSTLSSEHFDVVYSEQVLEHVENLSESIQEMARLSKKNSISIHLFPGTSNIMESHLKIPFIHWLPKKPIRRIVIKLFLLFGKRQKSGWPGIEKMSLSEEANAYYNYLNQKTYYRDIKKVMHVFKTFEFNPFQTEEIANPDVSGNYFIRNGFPNKHMKIVLEKKN